MAATRCLRLDGPASRLAQGVAVQAARITTRHTLTVSGPVYVSVRATMCLRRWSSSGRLQALDSLRLEEVRGALANNSIVGRHLHQILQLGRVLQPSTDGRASRLAQGVVGQAARITTRHTVTVLGPLYTCVRAQPCA